MSFEFATAARVVFGPGTLRDAGLMARGLGRRALVVRGRSAERSGRLVPLLSAAGIDSVVLTVDGEPDTDVIRTGAALARSAAVDLVLGIGGGSVIDAAKAVAAISSNPGDLFDYLEVIGQGRPLASVPLPVVAIPTTAGTGSEVTRNAVLTSREHRLKVSLRSPHMLPRLALVDPELTRDLPPRLTAATGLDALTQLLEAYLSIRANPMTDALTIEGIPLAAAALPAAWRDGTDIHAREDMALASLWSGMALANSGLGAVHGLAGPIGGVCGAPHGAVCAALLPHVMTVNLRALRDRQPASATLARFDHVARLVTGRPAAGADEGVRWLHQLSAQLEVPRLGTLGVVPDMIEELVVHAARASSMRGNPVALSASELREVLERAI